MSKMLDHHVVARAREIITDEKHWTQFDYAQLDSSDEADPADPGAVRFCAVGALRRAAHELTSDSESFTALADRVQEGIDSFVKTRSHLKSNFSIEDLNDAEGGHADVLKLFDDYLANSQCFLSIFAACSAATRSGPGGSATPRGRD